MICIIDKKGNQSMLENIRLSFQGIWAHKMRSLLTMLGIIIGIGGNYCDCINNQGNQ